MPSFSPELTRWAETLDIENLLKWVSELME